MTRKEMLQRLQTFQLKKTNHFLVHLFPLVLLLLFLPQPLLLWLRCLHSHLHALLIWTIYHHHLHHILLTLPPLPPLPHHHLLLPFPPPKQYLASPSPFSLLSSPSATRPLLSRSSRQHPFCSPEEKPCTLHSTSPLLSLLLSFHNEKKKKELKMLFLSLFWMLVVMSLIFMFNS